MKKWFAILSLILSPFLYTKAQLSGTSLMEYQYGQLPSANESSFNALYNKVKLNYRYQNLKVKAGVQYFASPYNDRNYIEPAWFGANYRNKGWELNLGNFNETLGRGILLRSYEIHGAIIEDLSYRSKQYFYRDMLGASASYRGKNYSVKTLWGYALNNIYPPSEGQRLRRDDEIAAISGDYKWKKQTIGAVMMRANNATHSTNYALGSLSGRLFPFLNYYTSYATSLDQDNKAHAIYTSLNLSLDKMGVSLEMKNYDNFVIGSGINEPPALIKEHSYRVLNRSTHVLQPQNETGFQLEAFYLLQDKTMLTFNYTYANNNFGKSFKYNELFLELSTYISSTETKFFVDYADDPFKNESDRLSAGTTIDQAIGNNKGLTIDLEYQTFKRDETSNQNYVAGLTFRHHSRFFIGMLSELSNDAFVTDSEKLWLSGHLKYKLNQNHSLQLFAGERRGGPACSAGVCYEVLDFKGVELRWNARF